MATCHKGIVHGNCFVGLLSHPNLSSAPNVFPFPFTKVSPNKYLCLSTCSCKTRTGYILCGAGQDGILEHSFTKDLSAFVMFNP